MIEIITDRLKLIPLSPENLGYLKQSRKKMERNLGLNPSNYNYFADGVEVDIDWVIGKVKSNHEDYLLYTYWEIVLLSENKIIGEISFFDTKLDVGEIGFVTNASYRGNGYMPEALNAFIKYLFSTFKIKSIEAAIDEFNKPSLLVAEKVGMKNIREDNGSLIWEMRNV